MHKIIPDWETGAISEYKTIFFKNAKAIQLFNEFKVDMSTFMKS